MYLIMATIPRRCSGGNMLTKQIPQFFLDATIQGIVSDKHATQVAEDILNPFNLDDTYVEVTAIKF